MTVIEYDSKFTQLSRYPQGLVKDEEERTKRFVRGLRSEIRSKLVLLRLQVYLHTVETALKLERDMQDNLENQVKEANTSKQPRYQEPVGFGASGSNVNRGSGFVMSPFKGSRNKGGEFWSRARGNCQETQVTSLYPPGLQEFPGARSVIQIILEIVFKIELVILVRKLGI